MGSEVGDNLGIGVIWAVFHSFGNFPEVSDRLNNLVTAGAMDVAVAFSIFADIRSGPLAFDGSSVERRWITTSSVQRRSSGMGYGTGRRSSSRTGTE